jgi:hypothetical protein
MKDCTPSSEMGKVGVLQPGGAPPIWIRLPISVLRVVQYEIDGAAEIRDPAAQLEQYYREWETSTGPDAEPGDKSTTTCFWNCCGCPALLLWTLAHFSDADFPLTRRRKRDLVFHTLEEASEIRDWNVSELKSTMTTDSLDYCWYFLVHLMANEEELAARAGRRRAIERHLDLIYWHYSYLPDDLCHYQELGWITTASPKEEFERRLIDLGAIEPTLKPIASRIIRKWDKLEEAGRYLRQIAENRSSKLYEIENLQAVRANSTETTGDVSDSSREQEQLLRKLVSLQRAMTPESDDDPAWHHPLEYIEKRAEGLNVIFLDGVLTSSRNDCLSNDQLFELALLERMAERAFCCWVYTEPERGLYSIQTWLKSIGESRSLKSLCDGVQQYMTLDGGRPPPSLRDVPLFPIAPEPLPVTQEIRYWQEVWAAKERAGAVVRLYMAAHDNERAAAFDWMRGPNDRKFLVIGDGGAFQGYSYLIGCATRDTSLVVDHRSASPSYKVSSVMFILPRAMRYAAYQVGRKRGWGVHCSAVLPIKDNQRLLGAFETGDLREDSDALLCSFMVTTSGGYADAVIFTADEDGDANSASFEPSAADSAAPLVGAGN